LVVPVSVWYFLGFTLNIHAKIRILT
jgi:hypothetical protein